MRCANLLGLRYAFGTMWAFYADLTRPFCAVEGLVSAGDQSGRRNFERPHFPRIGLPSVREGEAIGMLGQNNGVICGDVLQPITAVMKPQIAAITSDFRAMCANGICDNRIVMQHCADLLQIAVVPAVVKASAWSTASWRVFSGYEFEFVGDHGT
jgi:hypothetical protein